MKLEVLNLQKRQLNSLKKKKLYTISDFLEFTPKNYYAFGEPISIHECQVGDMVAIKATQISVQKKFMSNKKPYLTFRFESKGKTFFVTLFERIFEFDKFLEKNGKEVVVCGRFNETDFGPTLDIVVDIISFSIYKPYIHSVYPVVKGVADAKLSEMREMLLGTMPLDVLEKAVVEEYNMLPYHEAIREIHFPTSSSLLKRSRGRLLMNDLLYFSMMLKNGEVEVPKDTKLVFNKWDVTKNFVESLPYDLTDGEDSQKSILNEVLKKARNGDRIDMLVQGDVGCGKTIVAAAFMMNAVENGYQAILMAPREVLARQHYEEIKKYAEQQGFTCVFLGGTMKAREKKNVLSKISSGEANFIVGTHACIANAVAYKNLGAVVADEEHLFGVEQKEALMKKAAGGVHSLSMSATPIPRTMATVLYGSQKDIRVIRKKPAGRLPILTSTAKERNLAFEKMLEELDAGHQCYVVCPAIEDNDNSDLVSLESIEKEYRDFFENKGYKIGIVNGKLKKEEVEETISQFLSNEKQILLSTTVIEVGVNVPNSTVMVIEQANQFGLATLHQLRGRVGRNSLQSYCILICKDENNPRMQVMCQTNDGFVIAEEDLHQRGSGDLLGTSQSGINDFVEKMLNYPKMFEKANEIADFCIKHNYGNFLKQKYLEHKELEEENKTK